VLSRLRRRDGQPDPYEGLQQPPALGDRFWYPVWEVLCELGRFHPGAFRQGTTYREILRNLYYDTCLYTQDSIELLIRAVGADRCLFGTEKPGTGSVKDPATGRWVDDIHLLIDDIEWLDETERDQIFAGNAQQLFKL
jgi:4-oxalmesaconate hydratase